MSEQATSKGRVLFIEDDIGKRYVIARQLRAAGYNVDEAETGTEGLSKVSAEHDVVVLDLRLPDLHGWEVCRRIKASPETANVMVLELSASMGSAQDRAKGLELGADAYLVHPVELVELAATIDALTRLRRAVHERDTQRELFVATVSHDLRNPLATVATGVELLRMSKNLVGKDADVLARIDRGVGRMRQLIDQLLVFTQSMSGGVALELEPLSLVQVCEQVIADLGPLERAVELHKGPDANLHADRARLGQLVENLVTNALKHGTGAVQLTVGATTDHATLTVHNAGVPIRPEALGSLFEPFRRATERAGGFGLGLFIVDRIARAHGGEVAVASTADAGTTFTVRLPLGSA